MLGMECRRGQNCEHAHGVFELWLHLSRYRTRVCEYAHGVFELCPQRLLLHTQPEQLHPEVIRDCFPCEFHGHVAKSTVRVAEGSEVLLSTPSSSLLSPSPSSNSRRNEIEECGDEYDFPNIEWILDLVK